MLTNFIDLFLFRDILGKRRFWFLFVFHIFICVFAVFAYSVIACLKIFTGFLTLMDRCSK